MLYFPYNILIFLLKYTFCYAFFFVLNAASLEATPETSLKREILYLLAVGHYRAGDITRARRFIEEALAVRISVFAIDPSCVCVCVYIFLLKT